MDAQSYFVIQKMIKEVWEDWIVFNDQIELEEVMKIYDNKQDKLHYRVVKRTDKVLHLNQA